MFMDELNIGLYVVEERISDLEYRIEKIIQNVVERDIVMEKRKKSLRDIEDRIRKNGEEEMFEDVMVKNFLKLI